MSYVLDALRRAEADRQRGQVPGLHAPAAAAGVPPELPRGPAWRWLPAGVGLAAAVGAGAWLLQRQPAPPEAATAAVSPAFVAPQPSPTVPTALTPPAAVPPPVALPPPLPPVAAAVRPVPPPMRFGGAFDSPDPKARMLIVDGQVWREGEEPVPGWVLERIGLHAARFRVQGQAVELRYDGAAPALTPPPARRPPTGTLPP